MLALKDEISRRKDFLEDEVVNTIYFGGGTPSVLEKSELDILLAEIGKNYSLADDVEITLEANPDDLDLAYLKELKEAGVNRLSIGIQSFNDAHLNWMNRSHTNLQSEQCISDAASIGFEDITIDLIYGLPQLGIEEWQSTVGKALELPINHLSAYSLTLEDDTPYKKLVKQKKYKKPNNDLSASHYELLVKQASSSGWDHYEVSNFCKEQNYSKHNTSYWKNEKYLGLGPSAHSFDLANRYWNVRSNKDYIEKIAAGQVAFEKEKLTENDKINERLLTGLRTKWGVDLALLKSQYDYDVKQHFSPDLEAWARNGWMQIEQDRISLTSGGLLFADYIASELFIV